MKRTAVALILQAFVSWLTATGTSQAGLTIGDGMSVGVGDANVSLHCSGLIIQTGGGLNLENGTITHSGSVVLKPGSTMHDGTGTLNINGLWTNDSPYVQSVAGVIVLNSACGALNRADGDGDTDGDGMKDKWEDQYGLKPFENDSTGDKDNDGLSNREEYLKNTQPDDSDTDNDGLPDGWESEHGYDPARADSDNNGIGDGDEDPDGDGITSREELRLGLDPTINEVPEAVIAEPVQTVDEDVLVTLDGSGSSDPDDGIATWAWEQDKIEGVPDLAMTGADTAKATFTSPRVDSNGLAFTLKLTVTDQAGQHATAACVVNVTFDNEPPTAEAGDALFDQPAGTLIVLNGAASSDSDGALVAYAWQQTRGTSVDLEDAYTEAPHFTAPTLASEETLEFTLTVTDDEGLKSIDTVSVHILADAPTIKDNDHNDLVDLDSCFIETAGSAGKSIQAGKK